MNVNHFPQEAFLPARGLRQKLAELFNMRAYRPQDVRSIRTSVYYSDFEETGKALRYIVTTGQALRDSSGQFMVYPAKSRITQDPVRKRVTIEAGFQDHPQGVILCEEGQVIRKLKDLDENLAKQADYALAFPQDSIVNLRNDLHLNAAILIFNNNACNRYEIIQQQKSARYYNDRPVMAR